MRQQRKADLEKHVAEVNRLVKQANGDLSGAGETPENGSDDDDEEWEGIQDAESETINQEDEYIDEDKYTTVTIETVGIDKQGFSKPRNDSEDGGGDNENGEGKGVEGEGKKKVWTKEKPKSDRPKKKKKKFRYESKAERKAERVKQGLKKRKQAQSRKGK